MIDAAAYCRELETYLCRKNEGHLIRIVGPVFEQVCGWAALGVPLPVAFRGIDQYCERYHAKGARRRPVRIEFCEADILELFDDWRRAVGVTRGNGSEEESRGRETLPLHLDRVVARLTAARAKRRSADLDDAIEAAVRELDGLRARAKQARGQERVALIERLHALDRALVDAGISSLDAAARATLEREAEAELAPFAGRMTGESRTRAVRVAFERLVRDHAGLPIVAFE